MKTLLRNEISQVSGGNLCDPSYYCYYRIDAHGNFITGEPLWFSASPCPTIPIPPAVYGSSVSDIKLSAKDSKKYKIIMTTPNSTYGEATLFMSSDICIK
jgi:hypothetical protein